jgi:hypothetical protein
MFDNRRDEPLGQGPERSDVSTTRPLNGHAETEPDVEPVTATSDEYAYGDDEAWDDEPEQDEGVVRVRRPLFLAMVIGGLLAIVALGASTAYLAAQNRTLRDPVVARVNGEPIHRTEYDRAVAASEGADPLDGLIVERLVAAEARKRNITVSDAEVQKLLDDQRTTFGSDGQFQAALAQAGLTEQEFSDQLRLTELLRRMVADRAQVTDQEVNDAYAAAPAERFANQPEADAKEQIRASLKRQKENAAARELISRVRADASIERFLPPKLS